MNHYATIGDYHIANRLWNKYTQMPVGCLMVWREDGNVI